MNHIVTTAAGKSFDYDDPKLDAIDINAIMYQLSNECRWAGNVHNFYSVLQHSCLVAQNINIPALRIYGFVHDFGEAFVRDLPTPFKHWLLFEGADVVALERQILKLVYKRLGIAQPQAPISKMIDEADKRAMITEIRDVVKQPPKLAGPQPKPFPQIIRPQPPIMALEKAVPIFQACLKAHKEAM
ncbi:hypothetical protein [Maritalea sp.]|uniref:hypothetical protein n=1 Tax=Maritalea sp. TaxID=2003361 RepID=UPI003EF11DDA